MTDRTNILITGASAGLGAGMARRFAALGRNLALCARRTERLDELADELRSTYPDCKVVTRALDVTDHDAVFAVFDEFAAELGGLDRVVANAGLGKGQPLGTGYFAANKQTIDTNVVGLLAQCEAALRIFADQGRGHLVVMSSVAAVRGARGNMTAYAASKAAASSLAEGIRLQHHGGPIVVSTVQPGFIESEMTSRSSRTPMIVSADKGADALVRTIEREPATAFVPRWPWATLAPIMRVAPPGLLRRMM